MCFTIITVALADAKAIKATTVEARAFVKADKNKDIRLSASEFKVFVKTMARNGQPTAKKIRFFGAYKYAFSIADKNKDGYVTPHEMRSADNGFQKSN